MKRIIAEMEKNLTEEKKEMLSCIYEPTEVAYPGGYAVDSFAVQRSGEIRYYFKNDCKNRSDDTGVRTYLSTNDCGLTWEKHYEKNPAAMGKCIYVPEMDIFIKLIDAAKLDPEKPTPKFKNGGSGIYALISKTGSDDTNYEVYKVCDDAAHILRHVIYSASSGLLIATGENVTDEIYYSIVFTSADGGKTWNKQYLKPLDVYPITYPDKDIRWQNHSCEPTIIKLTEDELMIIFRTSYNYHYKYMSYDGGKTWSDPMPTDFHATLTMPTIGRMTDGDIIFTWCNTQPLPEFEHKSAVPPVDETVLRGRWEDCFTNRDANHIAVSSDNGKTWQGFREMALNPLRNESDFRTRGGHRDCFDKSVHQCEIVELPMNKLLVAYGQSRCCLRIIMLDRDWIKETSRTEDFSCGLQNVSTQVYLKSIMGGFSGYSGHCALNRTHGAVMIPSPDMVKQDVLFISRIKDDRLISEVQGAVWNFPAGKKGVFTAEIMNKGKGVALSLTDRWFNPIDTYVREAAQISVNIDGSCIPYNKWCTVRVLWDCDEKTFSVYADDDKVCGGEIIGSCPNGLCYVHFQSLAEDVDSLGTYIRFMEKK
ncbi:MAG: sialidase family protein [Clostridiales bacterium]|nr:sialidase family protein [Clostridiales bacterium]